MKPKVQRHFAPVSTDPRYVFIPLTQGKNALVDTELFEFLDQWNWHAYQRRKSYYARRSRLKSDAPGSNFIRLHNAIWEKLFGPILEGFIVDHINLNPLDNRRCNLRLATASEQGFNRNRLSNNSSGYVGVVWHKQYKKWHAQVEHNRKRIYSKLFDDPFSAAFSRDLFCKQHCPFAKLNDLVDRRVKQVPVAIDRRSTRVAA